MGGCGTGEEEEGEERRERVVIHFYLFCLLDTNIVLQDDEYQSFPSLSFILVVAVPLYLSPHNVYYKNYTSVNSNID